MMADDDIFARYPAVRGRPGEAAMLSGLLASRGLDADAYRLGTAALALAPGDMAVRDEVAGILSNGIAEFHHPMLIDAARNRAYLDAIARAVRPGMHVLEIGTGAGLLALAAARAGAMVTTCEVNPRIAEAARAAATRNGLADRIRVIARRSTDLVIPDDLPAPADLVIHEIFGEKLFNEGVTRALADARARLLKPGAPSLPPRAAIRIALVRLDDAPLVDLRDVQGFDLSPFAPLVPPNQRYYTNSRRLALLSPPATALRMDYAGPPPFGPARETVALASAGGRVDGVLQWLRLDFGGGHVLENAPSPDRPPSSWVATAFALPEPVATEPGDIFDVTVRHRDCLCTIAAARR